jgi:starch-binding outer membrane protein, SusD/RagB family
MKHICRKNMIKDISKSRAFALRYFRLIFITLAMIPLQVGCDYLEYNELDQYDKEDIFYENGRVKSVLTNVYSYLPDDFASVDGAMRSSASDDAVHEWDLSDIQKFNDGSWNPTFTLDDKWANMYTGIRAANVFLKEAAGQTFEDIRYNDNYEELMRAFKIYPYEARFLRAFFYFELVKRYKNVPLITTVLTQEEANAVEPSSFDDVINFIVAECDAAEKFLKKEYATFISLETGRATKGAALALKSKALLYAASPLFNESNDVNKWINAAKAAKNVIDTLGSMYMPLPTYSTVVNNLTSKEMIFERRPANTARTFEEANTAVGFIGGNTGTCPTQNLVDAYEVKVNGTTAIPFDWANPDHAANPYNPAGTMGRDPRLAATVIYNGTTWRTWPVEIYNGGLNAPPKAHTTKTGYYLRKYLVESINLDPVNPGTQYHYWVLFRYAEILLNYAEAMNEAYGPEVMGPSPLDNMTALQAINIIRARTGVAMPEFPAGMNKDEFRTRLRNERRVELAFEDHRFWDIRRWKIGSSSTEIRGVTIVKDGDVLTYTPKVVENRVWNDNMYLYPIPQTELFINDNLVQNPGWGGGN